MKAFVTLESLLEYLVFSTETLQHEDDLIAHSKVSKGERPQVQRENNIPQFHASPFNSSTSSFCFLPLAFTTILLYFVLLSCSYYFHINLSLHIWLQVLPASGEVPCGGALPPKVIPGPSPLLHTLIRCLIKVFLQLDLFCPYSSTCHPEEEEKIILPLLRFKTNDPSSSTIQLLN